MQPRRILTLATRIVRQFRRDRRTVALLFVVPIVILTLAGILVRSGTGKVVLAYVNLDEGIALPGGATLSLGDRVIAALEESGSLVLKEIQLGDEENVLRSGGAQGVLILPRDFTQSVRNSGQVKMSVLLEGSEPPASASILVNLNRAGITVLAGLASLGGSAPVQSSPGQLPLDIAAEYLYGGQQYDALDYLAPVFIGLFAFLLTFLLTCLAFQRERAQGTMERLLATPIRRAEIVLGYLLGFGLFAVIQSVVILLFTVYVLKIHYAGSLALVFVVELILVFAAVNLGIFLSTYAKNEFQVIQMYLLAVITQAFLSGAFVAVEDLPNWLRPLAYAMPLTYANWALRDVMIRGRGLASIGVNLLILLGFGLLLVLVSTATVQREVA